MTLDESAIGLLITVSGSLGKLDIVGAGVTQTLVRFQLRAAGASPSPRAES